MLFTIYSFPRGQLFLVHSAKGLAWAQYLKTPDSILQASQYFKDNSIPLERQDDEFAEEKHLFDRYFKGQKEDFTSIKLDYIIGTPYQQGVWDEARRIAYGETVSYKGLAERLQHTGYRSVGQALGKNPLIIIVPCHRIIGSDGSLTGFGAGMDLKEYLLKLENKNFPL
jgi:methylated-DNA-[protein]-cysteine S-methyltransferase